MVIKPTEKGKFYPLINKKGNYFFGVYVGRFRLKTQETKNRIFVAEKSRGNYFFYYSNDQLLQKRLSVTEKSKFDYHKNAFFVKNREDTFTLIRGEKVILPENFEETNFLISYTAGNTILGYCKHCTKKSNCEHNKILRHAMGDNFPFWSIKFIKVKYPDKKWYCHPHETVFCVDFESPQTRLPFLSFCDGILELIDKTIKK